jgi:hypothetical protein
MSDATAKSSQPARYENGRFGPGNPGRPPGARGRMGNRVIMAILEDFLANKDLALKNARFGSPIAYLNTILKLLPSAEAAEPPDIRAWPDADVETALTRVHAALDGPRAGRDALIELEALLLGEGPIEPLPALGGHRNYGD